jgi:hypothetical protein
MPLRGGVLIIGSLLWDDNSVRTQWRAQRLNGKNVKAVPVPIRYGRFSKQNRVAYTMVFSRLCYRHKELGQGVIVPFARSIATFDDLRQEAEFLAAAEGMNGNWEWGAVGLLTNAPSKFPADFLGQWTAYFREKSAGYQAFVGHTRSEAPTISPDGFLKLNWPLSRKDSMKYDFLLATPTKARIQNDYNLKRYPRPKEIAALVPTDGTRYYINNVLKGIRTSEDAAIWKAVTKLDHDFAAKSARVSSFLGKRNR